MLAIETRVERWKERLLDLSKKNRLINFRETKRSHIMITSPDYFELYQRLVIDEESLKFPFPIKVVLEENGEEDYSSVLPGNIETNKSINEQQKTLKVLRGRAKTIVEEQGINSLFLTFGILKWKESIESDIWMTSPLVLVPVSLTIASIKDPYYLDVHEDEIVINPTLAFKLENDFGISLPEFDGHESSIEDFIDSVKKIAQNNDWEVTTSTHLTLLSFLKINMYKDLNDSLSKIVSNPIVKALNGDNSGVIGIPSGLNNFDHDKDVRPVETFQVVDADSSQQDAILLAKRGVSFVLQGPPGTGKSQTITNIIAEFLADGKKVLFVSEKMAALDVVKKRLTEAGLDDFCLTLHSHKANKKQVLEQLGKTLNLSKTELRQEALFKLTELEQKRKRLNEYQEQLHEKCSPLNISIYEAQGRLANLVNTQDIVFDINSIEIIDVEQLNEITYLLREFAKTINNCKEDYVSNPWYGCNVTAVTHRLRYDIEVTLTKLLDSVKEINDELHNILITGIDGNKGYSYISNIIEILTFCSNSPMFPEKWLVSDLEELKGRSEQIFYVHKEYSEKHDFLLGKYNSGIFSLNGSEIMDTISAVGFELKNELNAEKYPYVHDVIEESSELISELHTIFTYLNSLSSSNEDFYVKTGIKTCNNLSNLIGTEQMLRSILLEPHPLNSWFNQEKLTEIYFLAQTAKDRTSTINENLQQLSNIFDIHAVSVATKEKLEKFNKYYADIILAVKNHQGSKREISFQDIIAFDIVVSTEIAPFLNVLTDFDSLISELATLIGNKSTETFRSLTKVEEMLLKVSQNPKPTELWFDDSKTQILDKIIADFKSCITEKEIETNNLLVSYSKDILTIDAKTMLARFNTEYTNFLKIFKSSYDADKKAIIALSKNTTSKMTDSQIVSVLREVNSIQEKTEWLKENHSKAQQFLGAWYLEEYMDWDVIDKNRTLLRDINSFFDNNSMPQKLRELLVAGDINQVTQLIEKIRKFTDQHSLGIISAVKGEDALDLGVKSIFEDLIDLVQLNEEMQSDVLALLKLSRNEFELKGLPLSVCPPICEHMNQIISDLSWFTEQASTLELYFGEGQNTWLSDWDNHISRIEQVRNIISYFAEEEMPTQFIEYVSNGADLAPARTLLKSIVSASNAKLAERVADILSKDNADLALNRLIAKTTDISNQINKISTQYINFAQNSTKEQEVQPTLSDLSTLIKIQEIEADFLFNENELTECFGFTYEGINSKWDKIIEHIEFATQLQQYAKNHCLSDTFIKDISCNSQMLDWCRERATIFKEKLDLSTKDFEWYVNLFEEKESFYKLPLPSLIDLIEKSFDFNQIEQWIDFRSVREECRTIGLADFVQKAEDNKLKSNIIENTFFRRFYRLWLDIMFVSHPAVSKFREATQNTLIQEFVRLDKEQFNIARSRIIQRLAERLPDSNYATSAVDEVGILKRELTKQKKLKPLRKLFVEIPNLLTALKPCLMMSPLSVSLYLLAEGYDFDLVIFDEASQVCTEDAVGAIMRGKQLIIAGDRNQLPPTNFFSAALSDNDFDNDEEEEDDTGAYLSILEEASNAIPERTLKWHYRSRHEHLIAFSNAKIYNHELITFPSNIEKVADHGVEYIFVESGVYDKGGKRNNVIEAKKVAEIVFSHFSKYPERSLGVVTFSEAQQQAAEAAINKMRESNPFYEEFFNDEIEQPFFIKNLENVQGDERDTIIFSIGYARDQNGQMYMNFGPLSRNGGEKRLNVAITRAKFNVKLVGSIKPTDIKSEITAEGVKLLRQYIEFAINGVSAIQNEITCRNSIDVESPFEESVYNFLTRNGFSVRTQVGCSGYRIDMAVRHPTISGVFVLGIECDGATYHSARTARERDRLRQAVLEDIGWKIHRIWSTDWVKNQKVQGEKLLIAVNEAIQEYSDKPIRKAISTFTQLTSNEKVDKKQSSPAQGDSNYLNAVEPAITNFNIATHNPYGFGSYKEADLKCIQKMRNCSEYSTLFIEEVVKQESPISFELLCKKYAPLMGYQKATDKVQSVVKHIVRTRLKDRVLLKEGFYWHISTKEVQVRTGGSRAIQYICKEELANAMSTILQKSFGIVKKDLFVAVARAYGFSRTGGNIVASLEQAYNLLLTFDKIKEVDGKALIKN